MATAGLFRRVSAVIDAVLGPDGPVEQIRIEVLPGGDMRIDLTTSAPGRLIGRRGTTADALRAGLSEMLQAEVQLNIQESPRQEPPLEPPSGVHEPRRPRPTMPSAGAALEPPVGAEPDEQPRAASARKLTAPPRSPSLPPSAGERRGAA